MKGRTSNWWRRLGIAVCIGALLGSALACEKSPREKLLQARTNLARETKPKETKRLLDEVLSSEPDNLQAKRLIAQVYQMQGEYKRAEEKLNALWDEHNFGDQEADLSTELRSARKRIRSDFVDLYKTWAENLDPNKEPDTYIGVVEKGLDHDNKDMDLNSMAVDFYWKKGQRLVEEGKKKEAAEAFEQIDQLMTKTGDERRQKAKKKARDLRLEFFMDEGRKRFDEVGAKTIGGIEGLTLSEDGETITIDVVQEVNRRLKPDNEKHAAKAKQIAFIGLVDKLRKLTLAIAGLPTDADLSKIGTEEAKRILLSKLAFDETDFQRGRYAIKGTLPVEEAIGMAYDIQTAYEKAEDEAKKKADEGGETTGDQTDDGAAEGKGTSDEGGGETAGDDGDAKKKEKGGDQP